MKAFFRELWYRFKRELLPYPLGFIGKYTIKWLMSTCKIELIGMHHLEKLDGSKSIVVFWHNRMVLLCEFLHRYFPLRHYAAFLSKSRDGEPIARVIQKYPQGSCIRVAHNARHQALREAIDFLNHKQGILLITPDGPKGPPYKVKPGVFLAAKEANAPIIAFSWEATSYWELNTWDKFRLPKPFSTIKIVLSEPIQFDPALDARDRSNFLQDVLSGLTE